ncbi:LysM peptidoglycan-binding domain-containing protein [Verrucomicrobiaceae bacterium N1E253]|uniref:LysM peptidoglycan-binding domain-containing protein n=1 Tax=Oceaniferula marina TaxID=2748318 RepID=A0A851GJ45_9BACT|nr:LysM domain-containing protein [Oceaniferula marina]NWK54680.1 LysM peptidoglycan-binding domain-containing protein [Oceaniferula marina]
MHLIKAIAALGVIGVVLVTAYLMKEYTGSVRDMPGALIAEQRAAELALKAKAEKGALSNNEPGEKAFQRARELLAMESMAEAEEKLKYIVSYYPAAEAASEARRILGEINVDRLLDPDWREGKSEITVQRGDTFTKIIRNNKTTMDSLVHLSKLMRADHRSLHPGDKLTVMPLDMRLVINIRLKTLTVWRQGEFIKEYPLVKVAYKRGGTVRHLSVGSIMGQADGKVYPSHSEVYRNTSKVIFLSDKSLAIRAFFEGEQDDLQLGFFLSEADMEELPLLLRPGNDVEIRH